MAKRKRRRRYTDEERADVVIMVKAGHAIKAVARHYDMPESTVRSWVNAHDGNGKEPARNAPPSKLYATKRDEILDLAKMVSTTALSKLLDLIPHAEIDDIHAIAGAFKLASDKVLLLEGEATERIETNQIEYIEVRRDSGTAATIRDEAKRARPVA